MQARQEDARRVALGEGQQGCEVLQRMSSPLREEAGHLVRRGPQVRREADHTLHRGLGWSVPVKSPALHRPHS